jgi:uncharacterized UBP type Zn finger protein
MSVAPFVGGLVNNANSCYFDSAIFAILVSMPKTFAHILKKTEYKIEGKRTVQSLDTVKKTLLTLHKALHDGKRGNANTLRTMVGAVCHSQFNDGSQQESGELLKHLLTFFDVETCKMSRQTFGFNNDTWILTSDVQYNSTPVYDISAHWLMLVPENVKLSNFLNVKLNDELDDANRYRGIPVGSLDKQEITFNKKRELLCVQHTDCLLISVHRYLPNGTFSTKPVQVEEFILVGKKSLQLRSIIMYYGNVNCGHYFLFFKHAEHPQWQEFDNMKSQNRNIGNFQDVLSRGVTTNGVVFLYE